MFYWTTLEHRGENFTVENGGRYEALDRSSSPARLKQSSNGVTPSSDVPELCVSASPEASLFAKIQSVKQSDVYHIYRTSERPDTKVSETALDFGAIEEHRYDMRKHEGVELQHFRSVQIPTVAVEDVKEAYQYAEPQRVNGRFAEAVKEHLRALIDSQPYPEDALSEVKRNLYKEYKKAYGEEMAERMFEEGEP